MRECKEMKLVKKQKEVTKVRVKCEPLGRVVGK